MTSEHRGLKARLEDSAKRPSNSSSQEEASFECLKSDYAMRGPTETEPKREPDTLFSQAPN